MAASSAPVASTSGSEGLSTSDDLKLTLQSPDRQVVQRLPIRSLTLVGSEGQIQVLPGHAPFIGLLDTGVLSYESALDGNIHSGVVSAGFFEVQGNEVIVLAQTLELSGEVDSNRARLAQQKAEVELQSADLDDEKFEKFQRKLSRAVTRQHFATREQKL